MLVFYSFIPQNPSRSSLVFRITVWKPACNKLPTRPSPISFANPQRDSFFTPTVPIPSRAPSEFLCSLCFLCSVPDVSSGRAGTLANPHPQQKDWPTRFPRDTGISFLFSLLAAKPERPTSRAPCHASLTSVFFSCQVRALEGRMVRTSLLVIVAFLLGLGIGYYARRAGIGVLHKADPTPRT